MIGEKRITDGKKEKRREKERKKIKERKKDGGGENKGVLDFV